MGRFVARRLLLDDPSAARRVVPDLRDGLRVARRPHPGPGRRPPARSCRRRRSSGQTSTSTTRSSSSTPSTSGNLLHGDLGTDFHGRPVLDIIGQRLPVTIKLTLVAVLFETIIGTGRRRPRRHPPQRLLRQPGPGVDHADHLDPDPGARLPRRQYVFGLKLRLVPHRRHQRGLVQLPAARPGARLGVAGLRGPADAHQHRREHARRLRPDGAGQGAAAPDGHPAAHRCATA